MVPVNSLLVEVAYAPNATTQWVHSIRIRAGSTVAYAIRQSGLLQHHPELILAQLKVGIFSKMVTLDTLVQAGDRIEIYRPLLIDPKNSRKRRQLQRKSK